MNWYELLFYKYIKGAQGQSKLRIITPVFKGGTEQILPENGSTPTTAPIIADIRYPDALRTDQTFLYRESPTQESGNARLRRIKGNTLAFNQLVQNGNFASTSGWQSINLASFTVSGNVGSFTASAQWGRISSTAFEMVNAHKYLVIVTVKGTTDNYVDTGIGNKYLTTNNQWETVSFIVEPTSTANRSINIGDRRSSGWTQVQVRNAMIFDLTLMGITADQFKSYFPLPYYSYQSTLLPFKGTGIKTTGANIIDYATIEQGSLDYEQGTTYPIDTRVRTTFIYLEQGSYTVTSYMNGYDIVIYMYNSDKTFDRNNSITNWQTTPKTFTMAYDGYAKVVFRKTDNSIIRPSEITSERMYDNNTESTTNLPTSTYFPNGMNSVGEVYDELIPTKAITRLVKYVVTGTEEVYSWSRGYDNHYGGALTLPSSISGICKGGTNTNGIASKGYNVAFVNSNMTVYLNTAANRMIIINDAYTTQAQWLAGITGLEVVLELATPTETDVNTEDTNEALSLLMGKSVSSNNAKQMIDIITKGE